MFLVLFSNINFGGLEAGSYVQCHYEMEFTDILNLFQVQAINVISCLSKNSKG